MFKTPRLSKIFTNGHDVAEMLLPKKLYEHKYNERQKSLTEISANCI